MQSLFYAFGMGKQGETPMVKFYHAPFKEVTIFALEMQYTKHYVCQHHYKNTSLSFKVNNLGNHVFNTFLVLIQTWPMP